MWEQGTLIHTSMKKKSYENSTNFLHSQSIFVVVEWPKLIGECRNSDALQHNMASQELKHRHLIKNFIFFNF